jgi:hypothetical protein
MSHTHGQKIFGIGLSRTGGTSLSAALSLLGFRALHFPADSSTRREIISHLDRGNCGGLHLSILNDYDALSDTPISSVFRSLDIAYPGSKFVLTIRDESAWLDSCRRYWRDVIPRSAWRSSPAITLASVRRRFKRSVEPPEPFDQGIRSLISNAVNRRLGRPVDHTGYTLAIEEYLYGGLDFDEPRFRRVYRSHNSATLRHFADRPSSLLVLDICGGQGWAELCSFLHMKPPSIEFPWRNTLAG